MSSPVFRYYHHKSLGANSIYIPYKCLEIGPFFISKTLAKILFLCNNNGDSGDILRRYLYGIFLKKSYT